MQGVAGWNVSAIYGILALLSLGLAVGYYVMEKQPERKFMGLYICVFLTNAGYYLLSISKTLTFALWANRISYFGAAFAVLTMVLIVMDACNIPLRKATTTVLTGISLAAFLLAATAPWQGLYYADVSIEIVDGVTRLVKTYGPLHILYAVYLLGYFVLMGVLIVRSILRKSVVSDKYAVFLAAVMLGNLLVWFVEQRVDIDFEFLSVSYILTEYLLLLLRSILRDYGMWHLKEVSMQPQQPAGTQVALLPPDVEAMFDAFLQKIDTLTTAEKRIVGYYMEGYEITDIPELAYISINTVKKHNRSIYQKLDVSSRDELMLYLELLRRCGKL